MLARYRLHRHFLISTDLKPQSSLSTDQIRKLAYFFIWPQRSPDYRINAH
jgi:hypothetical protein